MELFIESRNWYYTGKKFAFIFKIKSFFNILGPNKESAFLHALYSGAVSHSIAKACSEGHIPDCQCGDQPRKVEKDFTWAGCSDNIRFGNWFSRRFVDASEKHKLDSRALMNLHNNRVGRKILASHMQTKCKCHGVSGSCVTKTCWRAAPELEDFALIVKRKYERAQQVKLLYFLTNDFYSR